MSKTEENLAKIFSLQSSIASASEMISLAKQTGCASQDADKFFSTCRIAVQAMVTNAQLKQPSNISAVQRVNSTAADRNNALCELTELLDSNGGIKDAFSTTIFLNLVRRQRLSTVRCGIMRVIAATRQADARARLDTSTDLAATLEIWLFQAFKDGHRTVVLAALQAMGSMQMGKGSIEVSDDLHKTVTAAAKDTNIRVAAAAQALLAQWKWLHEQQLQLRQRQQALHPHRATGIPSTAGMITGNNNTMTTTYPITNASAGMMYGDHQQQQHQQQQYPQNQRPRQMLPAAKKHRPMPTTASDFTPRTHLTGMDTQASAASVRPVGLPSSIQYDDNNETRMRLMQQQQQQQQQQPGRGASISSMAAQTRYYDPLPYKLPQGACKRFGENGVAALELAALRNQPGFANSPHVDADLRGPAVPAVVATKPPTNLPFTPVDANEFDEQNTAMIAAGVVLPQYVRI